MNSELFSIGFVSIKWYSVLILCGVLLGYLVAYLESKRQDYPKDFLFDMVFWMVILGIIGARIYYVIFNFSYYKNNLLDIFKIWQGGLAIHGGIIVGLLVIIYYCRKYRINILQTTDLIVPSVILGQAIGRWGNFFNSEAYGIKTTRKFLEGLKIIPNFVIKGMYIENPIGYYAYRQPMFYYESLWCLAGFILLMILRKVLKNKKKGILTFTYFIWYGVGRFFIERLRTDSLMIGSLKVAQLVSVLLVCVGVVGIIWRFIKKEK